MNFPIGQMDTALAAYLADKHGVKLVFETVDDLASGNERKFDSRTRTLYLAPGLRPGQRAFQIGNPDRDAGVRPRIDRAGRWRRLHQPGGARAGADRACELLRRRADHALWTVPGGGEARRYDIELLGYEFAVGFETICHRLSTLQRNGARGVPFFFIRVDRAGNISKRQSATDFHFSRVGGTCPLWNVYEAFASPGPHPDAAGADAGRANLSLDRPHRVAGPRPIRRAAKTFAVALGCDVRHAERVVYSEGINLKAANATPIGMGCKVCERPDCAQRAFPPIGRALQIDETRSRFAPYATS